MPGTTIALLSHCRQIHQCAKIGGEATFGNATILKVPVSESPLFDKDAGAEIIFVTSITSSACVKLLSQVHSVDVQLK